MEYNNPNQPWFPPGYDPYKELNDTERMVVGCLSVASVIAGVIVALLLCALFAGCTTTRYIPVERHTVDTLRLTQTVRDSIYLSDSIYVSDFVRDDTVYKTVDRWHTRYVERTTHDTIYQARTDSIPAPYPVEVPVEKPLTWWQQARLHLANILLWTLGVVALFYVIRRKVMK
jgi:hypothetical protein